jgi:hypothetical protein
LKPVDSNILKALRKHERTGRPLGDSSFIGGVEKITGELMFKVIPNGVNRIDIQLSGKLNAEDMKIALDELADKSKHIENGKMLYEIINFHLPSLAAISIEFSRIPAMWGLMKKFNRAAVLTDKDWLKKISEFEGVLFPGLEIKAFDRDQKAEAEAWLSG